LDRQVTADEGRNAKLEEYVLPEIDVMLRVALSLTGNHADAEDLVQDALLRAYRAIDGFDGKHPRAWLLTILRNAHLNRVRRKQPFLFRDQDEAMARLEAETDPLDRPDDTVVGATFDHRVSGAFRELPEKFRDLVYLVDIEGLSYKEAAEVLGIKVGTVMSRLHRARKRMKERLQEQGMVGR
jgi:RNA polymerase sigma-70 factor (ECF subfamily)